MLIFYDLDDFNGFQMIKIIYFGKVVLSHLNLGLLLFAFGNIPEYQADV
ncbi:hypothetical protein Slin_2165 [Spirosoma linguale DSM 74]|uniref:Uncharacterized protein n=1 Tax=Spirosoma linguale (strain ATCC 33905 / DSM 74 / LMG 10896 / Claus 1) TaxID=504472 RepID=D2QDR2_SPILD|nr:hypothetical protein Slin_2165 [Spirosoma linguale DSM 74]